MFDAICIRRQKLGTSREPVDIVLLAEAMLFYQRTHLFADIEMITQLAREFGPDLLVELVKEGYLQISYVRKYPGIATRSGLAGDIFYDPVTMDATRGEWMLERLAPKVFSRAGTAPGYGRQLGRDFAGLVPTVDLGSELINTTKADFSDGKYVEPAIEHLLQGMAPDFRLPGDYFFRLTPHNVGRYAGFKVDTNVDFAEVSRRYNQRMGTEGDMITGPLLLTFLFETRCDLHFAAQDDAELATHEAKSAIIGTKFSEITKARANSQRNIDEFQRAVLVNSHEIGESIKVGYRTWSDYLTLLKQARAKGFKEWLAGRDPDVPLINEYFKALAKDTWVDQTPVKELRFVLFQLAGVLDLSGLVTVGLSALDAFLVDKLARGWKPSQFVNGPLKRDFARMD